MNECTVLSMIFFEDSLTLQYDAARGGHGCKSLVIRLAVGSVYRNQVKHEAGISSGLSL